MQFTQSFDAKRTDDWDELSKRMHASLSRRQTNEIAQTASPPTLGKKRKEAGPSVVMVWSRHY
jgi:hypothetical protein